MLYIEKYKTVKKISIRNHFLGWLRVGRKGHNSGKINIVLEYREGSIVLESTNNRQQIKVRISSK